MDEDSDPVLKLIFIFLVLGIAAIILLGLLVVAVDSFNCPTLTTT